MNDKAKTTNVATGLILYRVNYSYVSPSGQIRGGGIVVESADIQTAHKVAADKLTSFNIRHHKITSVKEY